MSAPRHHVISDTRGVGAFTRQCSPHRIVWQSDVVLGLDGDALGRWLADDAAT